MNRPSVESKKSETLYQEPAPRPVPGSIQHHIPTCNRCGKQTLKGNWRREGEEPVWYCLRCQQILEHEQPKERQTEPLPALPPAQLSIPKITAQGPAPVRIIEQPIIVPVPIEAKPERVPGSEKEQVYIVLKPIEKEQKRIDDRPNTKNSGQPGSNNSGNNSESSSINSDNSDSANNSVGPGTNSTVPLFERIGKVGRQRRYEERKSGVNSVRDVVLYRYVRGRQYPALSGDMKRWYEFFYFKQPMKGEKSFNANTSYEQHCEAYERGQEWIRRYEANRSHTN